MPYDDEQVGANSGTSAYDRMMGNAAESAGAAGSTSSAGSESTSAASSEQESSDSAETTTAAATQTSNTAAKTDRETTGIVSPQVTSRADQAATTRTAAPTQTSGATYQATGTGAARVTPAPTSNAAAKTSLPREATVPNTPVAPSYDPISTLMDLMSLFGGATQPQQQSGYDPLSSVNVPLSTYADQGMVWHKPYDQAIGGIVAGTPQSIYGPQPGATQPGSPFGGIAGMMSNAQSPVFADAVRASVADGTMAGGIAAPKIGDRVPMEDSQVARMMAEALSGLPNEAQPPQPQGYSQIGDAELSRQIEQALARLSGPSPTPSYDVGGLAVGNPLPGVEAYDRPMAGVIAQSDMAPAMARGGFPEQAQPDMMAGADMQPPLARGDLPTPYSATAMSQADQMPPMARGAFPADPADMLAQSDMQPPMARGGYPDAAPAAAPAETQTVASIINSLLHAFAGTPRIVNATPITTGETWTVEPLPEQEVFDIAGVTPDQVAYQSGDFTMSGPQAGLSSGLPQQGGDIDLTQDAYDRSMGGADEEPIGGPETQPDPGVQTTDIADAPDLDGYPPAGETEQPPAETPMESEIARVIAEAPEQFAGVLRSFIDKLLNVPGNIVDMPGQIASYFPPNAMNPAQQGGNYGGMMRQADHADGGAPYPPYEMMMRRKLAEVQRQRRNDRIDRQMQLILSTFT